MKKLIDSLKYGDRDTKIYLWSIIILTAATVIFGVAAVFMLSFFSGVVSVICAVIAALIVQNTSLKDKEFMEPSKVMPQGEAREAESEEKTERQEEEDKDKKEIVEEEISRVEHYTERQVVQIMHKHKVKRDNRKVMIDLCTSFRIRQSPAYFWAEAGKANFLVLEEEPRVIQIPLNKIKEISYERGISVQKNTDYMDFREGGFVAQIFEEVMPTYYMAMKNGKKGYFKNLYTITPDLKVTNTSARALFDILKLDFGIHDAITNSNRYSEYYKMAYRANVLWKDQVISTEEYRERIKEIFKALREMGMHGMEYNELAEQMVESKFITREYAEYYKNL
ncbi:DUF4118 domain-containing protein [Acetivibrio ethanolgignens]|uniref:Uncharacterized protein n=1 Tax=Acetivibrio ethanolgignens TaxID=290052 RepID=A0A0V8QEJ0_9FIRM|nr:DUF4118 domain-containing protein [Acetivibrio ethanolgignens]KSV58997.1 hypothetical protein ASU35_10590 [Acetivibrio ethanolgignens]